MQQHMHTQGFTKEQKVGFLLLFVFAIFAVGLGFLQIRNTIYAPFAFDDTAESPLANVVSTEEQQTLRLKSIDTDNDGLYDYDEIYLYQTSPYIEDTDSDGVSDAREIETSTDPLCPKGEVCDTSDPIRNAAAQTAVKDGEFATDVGEVIQEEAVRKNKEILDSLMNNPAYIRNLLVETGQVTYEQLEKVSDEDIISYMAEVLDEQKVEQFTSAPDIFALPESNTDNFGQNPVIETYNDNPPL